MTMIGRIARAIVALALASCAGLVLAEAARLFTLDVRAFAGAGALLAIFAIALVAGQLSGYVFAILFMSLSAVGLGVATLSIVRAALYGSGGASGWEFLRGAVLVVAGLGFSLGALLCAGLALFLFLTRRGVTDGKPALAWAVAVVVALLGLGSLAWAAGYEYAYREAPKRHHCLSGHGLTCYYLARDLQQPLIDRRELALHGCQAWYDGACGILGEFPLAAPGERGPEVAALHTQCLLGRANHCLALGKQFLNAGERVAGRSYLDRACAQDLDRCVTASELATAGGEPVLAVSLLQRGCDLDNPRSCTRLLLETGRTLDQETRGRLELKACLLGDVNDCRPLMRADLEKVCEAICAGGTENRFHTCGYCARDAAERGQTALAERWLASNCEKGYKWSCAELEKRR